MTSANRIAISSDGRSSPTNSAQGSVQSTLRIPQIDSNKDFQEKKRSFKNKLKDFFKRRNKENDKVQDQSSGKNKNKKDDLEIKNRRIFYINDRERNSFLAPLESNYIRTTKYTIWSYLPLSLMFQFKRLPNFYFLLQAILNSIPLVSALHPISAYLPLAFVLLVSMVREGIEDYARYRSDKVTNRQPVRVVENGQVSMAQAKDLKVGDLILVEQDEMFPADLVLMASSDPDASCYIQTSSLDGEKAMKTRKVPKNLDRVMPSGGIKFQPDEFICSGLCEVEAPHGNIYSFQGRFRISRKNYALEPEQMLLKGTFLRNTRWVVGLIVYTGKETRIMMNSQKVRNKQSDIEKMMNKFTFYVVTTMLVMTFVLALLGGFWHSQASEDYDPKEYSTEIEDSNIDDSNSSDRPVHFYIDFGYSSLIEGSFTFLRYFQLLSLFLPTSLFVSVEFLKVYVAHYMNLDWRMINTEICRGVSVQNMSIVEDLGMIHYVFSDKTGTLTRNQMEFHSMCVGQEILGPEGDNFNMRNFEKSINGQNLGEPVQLMLRSINQSEDLQIESQSELLTEFMTAMSLTHNCITVEKNEKIVYQGQSPDEITLVDFAKKCGFEFVTRTDTWAVIKAHWIHPKSQYDSHNLSHAEDNSQVQNTNMMISNNVTETDLMDFDRSNLNIKHPKRTEAEMEQHFEVEQLMDFSSDRKRMSILVRDLQDDKIKLYSKGADSEIKKRLKPGAQDENIVNAVEDFVKKSSTQGLRTLLFAMRVLDEEEVHAFQVELENIQNSLDRIEIRTEELYSQLETNLTLIGATALEDRLADNVPEVINDLHEANIKVWMLTGDQFDTAENIARSCRLIKPDFEIYRIKTREQVEEFCSEEFTRKNDQLIKNNVKRALIVEAPALISITERADLEVNFIRVSKTCEAVICCRVSPKQKAEVVRMIKQDDPQVLTLAVGDGANDVSMINEAHVGIGIYGNEGLRAVQSSDFAIPEFQTLRRLLLVHGRCKYISVSKFIMYFFYKNAVMTMPQFLFAYYCGFSATSVFDDFYINLYNTFFTCLPPLALGIFYWDVLPELDEKVLLKDTTEGDGTPKFNALLTKLYYVGQRRKHFNTKNFFWMEAQAMFDSVVIFFICFFSLNYNGGQIFDHRTGHTADLWAASVTCFTALVIVVHFNLLTRVHQMTWLHILVMTWGASFIYFLYMWIGNFAAFSQTRFVVLKLHETSTFYLAIACSLAYTFSIDLFVECYRVLISETPSDFLRQLVYQGKQINETNYNQFKRLVNKEERQAYLKREIERSVADLRQIEFLRLRQSSIDSRPGSQQMVARPSVSREASRNAQVKFDGIQPIRPSEEEVKMDKKNNDAFGISEPKMKMPQNTKSISQSVRVAPQSFVTTQTIGQQSNQSPSPSPEQVFNKGRPDEKSIELNNFSSQDPEISMQGSQMKPVQDSEIIDSEIASNISSEIERAQNDSNNSRNIESAQSAGKRFSGAFLQNPQQMSMSHGNRSDMDSPHSLSVDNSDQAVKRTQKRGLYVKKQKQSQLDSLQQKAFGTIDESMQEEDEAKSKKVIDDESSEMSIDRMTEQLDQLSLSRQPESRFNLRNAVNGQRPVSILEGNGLNETSPSHKDLELRDQHHSIAKSIQENNFVRESGESPLKSLPDLESIQYENQETETLTLAQDSQLQK